MKKAVPRLAPPLGAAMATVLLAVGCGSDSGSGAGSGDAVVMGMTDKVTAIDPAAGYDPGSWLVFNNVFQSLLSFPKGSTEPEPEAAKECSFEDSDSRVYTCKLQDGLKFSDGSELTSEDVKFSFERTIAIDDPVGERISLVDEKGRIVEDDRALLVMLDLVAAERRSGRVAMPVTTTRIAEQVAAYHGTQVEWTTTSPDDLARVARMDGTVFGGDGRGGFIVPEFSSVFDGAAAFARLTGLVARTQLTLSQIDARIPQAYVLGRDLATPWAVKGMVMRRVVEAAGSREVDTTDGVRVVEADGRWVLVLPDRAEAVTHLWAEGPDQASAEALLDEWAAVVDGSAD